jgi:hypothetical protein
MLITTKEKVLRAAKRCPNAKEVLKVLFPEAFEEPFDWHDLYLMPFRYLTVRGDGIHPSVELIRAARIKSNMYPSVNLGMLKGLIDHIHAAYKEAAK